jgi:hypothetical protein
LAQRKPTVLAAAQNQEEQQAPIGIVPTITTVYPVIAQSLLSKHHDHRT